MDLSLSVVLPVHNAETTLTHRISELLEVLPEVSSRFEILIVDDGSTDHTEEIAHELARCFPQLRVVRHHRRCGDAAATQTGMAHTSGDVVFVQDETSDISAADIRGLWEMRHDTQLVMARAEKPCRSPSPHLLDRRTSRNGRPRNTPTAAGQGGIQMIRRVAVEELEELQANQRQFRISCALRPKTRTATVPSNAF